MYAEFEHFSSKCRARLLGRSLSLAEKTILPLALVGHRRFDETVSIQFAEGSTAR